MEREYQRSAPVVQVSRYILRIPNPATEASSVHASQPRCNSHGFTPLIRTALNEGFSCLLHEGDQTVGFSLSVRSTRCVSEQSDSPCPLQMCTQSGQRQCLSDLILCEVTVSQIHEKSENGKLVRIVTKREFTRHRDKNSC